MIFLKTEYSNLFKSLVDAYYKDDFENYIAKLLSDPSIDKDELSSTISSLCGVELKASDSSNYFEDLSKAINSYSSRHKIVNKIKDCSMECSDELGKTACQRTCPFDAILIDKEKSTSYIAADLCTDCGLCVDACPSGSILDKVEFMPLSNLLKSKDIVIAAVAPAIIGQFGENVSIDQLRAAFKKLGFTDMVEVAFFADMLTLKGSL